MHERFGVIYTSEKLLPRDSGNIFRRPGGPCDRVGRPPTQSDILAVSQHKLIANADPRNVYRRFGFAEEFLCDAEGDDRLLHAIRSEDVVCHFAKALLIPREEGLMHALPLNTVGHVC